MYQDKLACAIKVGGKVLREHNDTVFLPFGSEYSFLIKNLNNRRACVRISIDGQEVVDGGLIVNANSSVELERFVKSGQLNAGNRFKFIERTAKVEQARGIQLEDGLIRIEFEFETPPVNYNQFSYGGIKMKGSLGSPRGFDDTAFYGAVSGTASYTAPETTVTMNSVNDAGITVAGSISEQKFTSVYFAGDGQTSVMVFKLLGETVSAPVTQPLTVKTKQKCSTCNHMNKSSSKFCSECGTSLEVV